MEMEKLYPDGELYHYGTPRHSGRYPWGSGKDPYQSAVSFRSRITELKRAGMTEVEIARSFGMNTTQLRNEQKLAKARQREYDASLALKLHDKGWSNTAIAERMGRNESSVRNLLNPTLRERNNAIAANASSSLSDGACSCRAYARSTPNGRYAISRRGMLFRAPKGIASFNPSSIAAASTRFISTTMRSSSSFPASYKYMTFFGIWGRTAPVTC